MGYAKKERKEKISIPKGMREKGACQRAWRKEKKKKKINKDSPYFQIKGIHDSKEYQKYLELGHCKKFHTLARLDQSVWLASPWVLVFDLAKYVMQVYPTFIPTQSSTQSL
jgi:hypothetical protein